MLYYLFDYLAQYNSGFNVFHYLTLRIILAALTALVISLILGPIVINYLHNKKLYQNIIVMAQNHILKISLKHHPWEVL